MMHDGVTAIGSYLMGCPLILWNSPYSIIEESIASLSQLYSLMMVMLNLLISKFIVLDYFIVMIKIIFFFAEIICIF